MLFIHQNISVSCLSILHVNDGLVGILEWSRVCPGVDIMLDAKSNMVAISLGDPVELPPSLASLVMRENTFKAGILSSGAPTYVLLEPRYSTFEKGHLLG